jgi:hypothetical protein
MVGVSTGFALSSSPGQCGDAAIVTGAFSYHLEAMQQKWKPGDLVVVVTVNRGLPVQQERKGRKPRDAAESWAGEIAGPSLVGPGWWNVRRLSPKKRTRSGVYAVPDGEIRSRKR